jgi:transposase-like protein
MRQAFNTEYFEIDQLEKLVIMSDREKGLSKAVSKALPNTKHSHCCQHIAANIQSRFGIICQKLFWSAVYARTKAEFDTAIDSMLKESVPAAAYLRSIPAETWATYAFPLPCYGHITSNIVESLNGTWKHLWHLPPL